MSVTFTFRGANWDHPLALNLANDNARELLAWLGYGAECTEHLHGELEPGALAIRCEQRLCEPRGFFDLGVRCSDERGLNAARRIEAGRRPGYLREKAVALLALIGAARGRAIDFA